MYRDIFLKFNFYKNRKAKEKKIIREEIFNSFFFNFLSSMFEYNNIYDGMNADWIEFYNIIEGQVGAFEKGDKKIICGLMEGGGLDEYGIPLAWNGYTMNDTHKNGIIDGVSGVVGFNNKLHIGDIANIERFANKITEVDISEDCLIRYARLKPIPIVSDSRDKTELDAIIQQTDDGVIRSFLSKGKRQIGENALQTETLTDVNATQNIQYLTAYYNELMNEFFMLYGMDSNFVKRAQQSVDEIHNNSSIALVLPFQMLAEREKFCEKCNTLWGGNMSVNFSDTWLKNVEDFFAADASGEQTTEKEDEDNGTMDERDSN